MAAAIEAVPILEAEAVAPVAGGGLPMAEAITQGSLGGPTSVVNTAHELIDEGEKMFDLGKNMGKKIFRIGRAVHRGGKLFSRAFRRSGVGHHI